MYQLFEFRNVNVQCGKGIQKKNNYHHFGEGDLRPIPLEYLPASPIVSRDYCRIGIRLLSDSIDRTPIS